MPVYRTLCHIILHRVLYMRNGCVCAHEYLHIIYYNDTCVNIHVHKYTHINYGKINDSNFVKLKTIMHSPHKLLTPCILVACIHSQCICMICILEATTSVRY